MDIFCLDESPAVIALGPQLFKLTEIHIWDDGSIYQGPNVQEPIKLVNGDYDFVKSDSKGINELNDLGLPLSFQTNKEKRNGVISGKQKGSRKNNQSVLVEIDDKMLESTKVSEEECRSPASILNTSKMLGLSEVLQHRALAGIDGLSNLSRQRRDSMSSSGCTSTSSHEHYYSAEEFDLLCDNSLDSSSELSKIMLDETDDPRINEMVATRCHDDGTSDGSCLINEGADCNGKGIKEELESLHLEVPSLMEHYPEVRSNDMAFDAMHSEDFASYSQFSEQVNSGMIDNHVTDNSGEWISCWDNCHMRTYLYNLKTEESTWDPPPGMEYFLYGNTSEEQSNKVAGLAELGNDQSDFGKSDDVQASYDPLSQIYLDKDCKDNYGSLSDQFDESTGSWLSADNASSTSTTKRKKKVRRIRSNRKLSLSSEDLQGIVQEISPSINKYWYQRYLLFSRFDYGIKMDEEGWFSATPELIAKHHAARCGSGAIIDFFTGVGGNAIQFARRSKHVTAIDIDPNKIEYARHNATIYGVDANIDFIKGDSFSLAPKLKANTVFMSPPWGGPNYSKVKKFDINTMLKPRDGLSLFAVGKGIAPKIVMFLPRNVDINQLAELALSATPPWSLEVERNFLNGRLKAVTAYFLEPSEC